MDDDKASSATMSTTNDSAEVATKSGKAAKEHKSSQELCDEYGINNLDINYTDAEFNTLTTYKLFNQHVKPLILAHNPKLVMSKMVSVISAKWREFNELKDQRAKKDAEEKSENASQVDANEDTADTAPDTPVGRNKRAARKRPIDYDVDTAEETENTEATNEQDDDETYGTRRTSARAKKNMPQIKIKLGGGASAASPKEVEKKQSEGDRRRSAKGAKKRRRDNENDSDAEFEAMLEEQYRIDEAEQANKKKRQSLKKAEQAAKAAASTSTVANTPKSNIKRLNQKVSKKSEENDGYEVFISTFLRFEVLWGHFPTLSPCAVLEIWNCFFFSNQKYRFFDGILCSMFECKNRV